MNRGVSRSGQILPWAVCVAAGVLGLVVGPILDERAKAGSPHVSVSRVQVTESLVPPCGPAATLTRDLLVVTGHMQRETAKAVAQVSIRSDGARWEVRRQGNRCSVTGPAGERDESCLVESCSENVCALRIPLDIGGASGDVEARYADAGGRHLGGGTGRPGAPPAGEPPALRVTRDGPAVEIRTGGGEDTPGRVTVLRKGVAVADAPLRYDSPGLARITVPDGSDGLVVAVSSKGSEGVVQASAHLDGPFDGSCGPASGPATPGRR